MRFTVYSLGGALIGGSIGVAGDYRSGDLITQMLPGNLPHIAIVSDRRSADGARPLVIHDIGRGAREEDGLFAFPVTGHYRFSTASP